MCHCIFTCIVVVRICCYLKDQEEKNFNSSKNIFGIDEATWQTEWEEMAYFKCIGKGSALTLEEAITIAKNVT